MSSRKGFTLIEILVVIGIVAILTGILLPAVTRARIRSKRPICIANLRQIGIALHAYAQDWGGCAPPYTTFSDDYVMWGEGEPPRVVDLRPYNDPDDLKQCFAPYGVVEAMWWCPVDPCPGKAVESLNMMDHTKTSYLVDHRVAIWQPVNVDSPPVVPADIWQSHSNVFWHDTENPHLGAPYYLLCWPHKRADMSFLYLRFDGSIGMFQ